METLKFLLQGKKADSTRPREVVSAAVAWMHTQLANAEIAADYFEGGANFGTYGYFQIKSIAQGSTLTLHIKIAEINGHPYVYAEVKDQRQQTLFPYFGEIGSNDTNLTLLHFIADFYLSTTPVVAETSG